MATKATAPAVTPAVTPATLAANLAQLPAAPTRPYALTGAQVVAYYRSALAAAQACGQATATGFVANSPAQANYLAWYAKQVGGQVVTIKGNRYTGKRLAQHAVWHLRVALQAARAKALQAAANAAGGMAQGHVAATPST